MDKRKACEIFCDKKSLQFKELVLSNQLITQIFILEEFNSINFYSCLQN